MSAIRQTFRQLRRNPTFTFAALLSLVLGIADAIGRRGGMMIGAGVLAAWLPARRAASVDPMRCLKQE